MPRLRRFHAPVLQGGYCPVSRQGDNRGSGLPRVPGLRFGSRNPEQACTIQAAISEAYRFQEGMMTGREIAENRWAKGLSQEELAGKTGFPLREIQCWEAGAIQSREQDDILRQILAEE